VNTRRQFISLLGGAAALSLARPLPLCAQQPTPTIGLLSGNRFDERELAAVRKGLAETGYAEGRNVVLEYRSAEGRYDRLPALAAELERRPVTVIVAIGGTASAVAAKAATTTVPIIFANGGDPVRSGLVPSLNRPGGRVTGVSFFVTTLGAKRLELLRALVPRVMSIGFLINPANPNAASEMEDVKAAALALNLQIQVQNAPSERDLETAFAAFVAQRLDAVIVAADAFFLSQRAELAALAVRHALPAMCDVREHVLAGGLISYGTDRIDAYRQGGVYTGRVLKGEQPSDLPVMQSTKFELVINLKTANALGLTIPPTLLAIADEVIE
jgi:putative tryptophan/tyrosine transport system substrate-binding protein